MMTKDINYGKTERGTNLGINLDAVTVFFLDDPPSGDLEVDSARVYTPGGPTKNRIYTSMGGSLTISIMVYEHFGGLHELKV